MEENPIDEMKEQPLAVVAEGVGRELRAASFAGEYVAENRMRRLGPCK